MLRCNLTNIILFVILQFLTLSNSQEQEQLELLKDDPQYEAFKKRHVLTWSNKQGIEFIHGYKNENVPPVISVLKTEPKIGEYTQKNGNNYESKAAIVFESFYTARVGTETQYRCLEYNQKIELTFQNNKPIHFQTKLKPADFTKSNYTSNCKFLKNNLVIPTSYEYSAGEEIIGERASIDSSSFNTTHGEDLSNSQEQELEKDDPQYDAFVKRHILKWHNKVALEFINGYLLSNKTVPDIISVLTLEQEPKLGAYNLIEGDLYESKANISFESFYTKQVRTEKLYRCLSYNQKIQIKFNGKKPTHFQTRLNKGDFTKAGFHSDCGKILKADNLRINPNHPSYENNAGAPIIEEQASIGSSSFNTTDGDLSNSQGQEPEPLKDDPQYNAFVDRHILKYDNKLASEFFNAYLRSNRTVPPVISVVGNKNQVPMLGAYNLINGDLYESKAAIAFESFYTKQVGTEQLYRCLSYNQKIQIRFKGTKPTHFETILNKDDFLKSNFRSTCGTLLKALNLRVHPFYENNAGAPIIGERASIDSSSFNTTDGDLSNSQEQEPEPLKDDPQYDAFVRRHILKYDNKGAIEFFNGYLHSKKPVPDIISVVGNKYQVPMLGAYNLIKGDLYESKAAIAFESFYTKQVGTEQLYRCLSYNQKIQIKFKGTKPTHFETRLNKDDFLKSNFRSTCGRLLHADNLRIHPFYENNAGAPIIEEQAIIGSSSFNTTDGTGSLINGTIAKENENPSETIIAPSN